VLNNRIRRFAPLAAVVTAVSCGGLLDVEAPGAIRDEDLNSQDAIPGLIVGMAFDLAESIDDSIETLSLAAGELFHGGSYNLGDVPRGIILPEDVNGEWGTMHQARWVAEQGIVRIRDQILTGEKAAEFDQSPYVARAFLLAGLANRQLGENLCFTAIDGQARESNTVHFPRGEAQFNEAIRIGGAAGSAAADIVTAAYAGRASVRAWQGNWAGAVEDAARVPAGFVYLGKLSPDGESNILAQETHNRFEYSVWGTEFAERPDDARAPWVIVYRADGSVATGANGATLHYQQKKYTTSGDDIPLVKGTEMLVLRAEAALRNADIAGAFTLLNEARAAYSMAALPVPATIDEAWDILHAERGATVWLENRRLWDLRRWFAETGPAHHDFLNGRDQCIPVSEEEMRTNPASRG
jgi:hypothetical protein